MNHKNHKIRVLWNDVRVFSPDRQEVNTSEMETIGYLERETGDFLIIKEPLTKNLSTGTKHPIKRPTYYFIPRGMITKIENR